MYYRQQGGPGMSAPQQSGPSPEQIQQMFAQLPPEVQAEIKKLPQEQQAQIIVAAFQKMQEMMQGGAGQQAQGQPMQEAPKQAMQEGGAPQGNPSSDRMAQLAQGAPDGAQVPQGGGAGQPDPEQLKQMFAQLPPEIQQQIQQLPPEQQPQAIIQAFQQMQQGGQQQAPEQQMAPEQGMEQAPQMAMGGSNMFTQDVDPSHIYKMAKGGHLLHDGMMFKGYNIPHDLKGDSEYTKVALMKCGGSVRMVKYGKKKMQTGGPTDKSGSTYKRGDSIKGPVVRVKRTEADFIQDSTLQNMNRGNSTIRTVSTKPGTKKY